MPAFRPNSLALILVCLILALAASAQDLHFKRNVSVGGNAVASSEVWVKGARERSATSTSAGSMVSLRQCDLKRTVTINDQGQTYLVMNDPQDDSAAKAAAMFGGAPQPAQTSGGTITQTVSVVDTGEHKVISGYAARHLKTTVSIEPSANACSQTKQKFDIDGWYTDVIKEQTTCAIALPPTNGAENCSDRVILHRKGTARPGYPLLQAITIHNDDGSSTKVEISATEISKDTLKSDLFDVPAGYREVKSNAELYAAAIPQTPAGSMPSGQQFAPANGGMSAGSQFPNMAAQMGGQNAMMSQMGSSLGMQQGMAGMSGSASGAGVPLPQALGPKAPGRIRIGIAPAQAQLGQGNNAQADYPTPIRNAMIFMMAGPAVEIAALDSRIPIQLQAEAQQKQCDYVLMSGVTVKHSSSGFGKFMKAGSMASNMTPVGMMAHSMTAMAASQAAAQAAAMTAQQQAVSQLSQFNGQIKSKDDVTVDYQLYPTGQPQPKLQNSLKGKAKADGEDVLTPLIQQAATNILTEVTKK
ncbi:MAG TPA: hypothetical protein VFA85_15475 [Terriglobales bacterium]|nr:hypothetical protein [Terriglobales bacterium]